jgi:ATP-dependent protease ClpP protease subunit
MRQRRRITNRATTGTVADRIRTTRPRPQLTAGRTDWYQIRNASAPVAEVWIYDEIGYWGTSAADFVRELAAITASQIELRLNSPGGEVFDGIAIMNALRSHPASVTAYVDGMALSAASFILQAADKRVMRPQAQLMIHDAMGIAVGNAADMQQMADELDRISDTISVIYAERGDGTAAKWRERMRAETWYGPDEAVAAGLADEVDTSGTKRREMENRASTWDLSIFRYPARNAAPDPQLPPAPVVASAVDTTPALPVGRGGDGGEHPAPTDQVPDFTHWTPDLLRDAITAHANDALAPPPVVDPDPDLTSYRPPPRLAVPAPPAAPAPAFGDAWDPSLFAAAVQLAADDAPAPNADPPASLAVDPYDGTVVTRALREAIR